MKAHKTCISIRMFIYFLKVNIINPLNAELNPICHLLSLLGAHHIFHVSGIRVKQLYGEHLNIVT